MADRRTILRVAPNRQPAVTGMRWATYVHPSVGGVLRSASVGSLEEAGEHAERQACALHVDPVAYDEMVAAGVAPPRPPAEARAGPAIG